MVLGAEGGGLAAVALLVGSVGALLGGLAALLSARRRPAAAPSVEELERAWANLHSDLESERAKRIEAEKAQADAEREGRRLLRQYEDCNRERLELLRARP